MTASPSTPPDFTRLAAPLLFGPLFNWTLYGALCIQIYVYSYNFPNDKLSIKVLGGSSTLLQSQTALTGADLYFWFVAGFGVWAPQGHPFRTHRHPHNDRSHFVLVQGFCYRIWMLNKRLLWFCWIIAICTVTQSTGAIWGAVTSLTGKKFEVSKAPLYLWSIMSATADIMIAVAMTLLLRRAHGKFSNFVLIRVVRLTIETNALTASVAVASLVLYAAFPNHVYYAFT
ncbi:hypothetical protein EDB83DRAFT_2313686, partial [Lactarius deliciosus]